MSAVQLKLYGCIGEVRHSQHARGITPPGSARNRIQGHTTESQISYDVGGLASGEGSMELYMPQDADFQRLRQMRRDIEQPIMTLFDDSTVGSAAFMTRVQLFGAGLVNDDNRPIFASDFSIIDDWWGDPGEIRFSSIGTSGVTAPVSGTGKEYSGGVSAGKRMVAHLHPYNRTGGASNCTVILESASDSGFTADVTTHKTWAMTSTGGGLALRGPADYVLLDGDVAAITNTHFRFRVTVLSAGAWYLLGAISLADK